MVTHPRMFRKAALTAAFLTGSLLAAQPASAQITQVDYASLTGTQNVNFSGVTGGTAPGTNYNGILVVDGVHFGERFKGQTVTANAQYDQISGLPDGNLVLLPGDPGQNLDVFTSPAGPVLSGIGPLGYPENDGIGEGAVSILFGADQSQFGFQYAGGNGGDAYVSFFRVDGSLIGTFTLSNLALISSFGFVRDGGIADIRGVNIWNADVTGIGLRSFRFDVAAPVPEPATWAMMLLGFGLIGFAVRRQRRTPMLLPQLG
jgi:hypothetical protein